MTTEEAWDYLTDNVGVSEETLQVATSLDGYTLDTLESVLFILTGEREFPNDDEDEE